MYKTLLAILVAGPLWAQTQYPSESLKSKIVPIGNWDMFTVPSVNLALPSGVAPNKIVHLSALIYSDPIGTSAAVFRIDHFAHSPKLANGSYGDVLLGGIVKVQHNGTAYRIVLDRGQPQSRQTPLFRSDGSSRLPDGTPVSFKLPSASVPNYNRGVVRIVYIP